MRMSFNKEEIELIKNALDYYINTVHYDEKYIKLRDEFGW